MAQDDGGGEQDPRPFGTEEITQNLRIRRAHVKRRAPTPVPVPAPREREPRPTCKLASHELVALIADKRRRAANSDLHVTMEVVTIAQPITATVPSPPRLVHTVRRTPAVGVPTFVVAPPLSISASTDLAYAADDPVAPAIRTSPARDLLLGLTIGLSILLMASVVILTVL
jgi:hypothetical protein